MVRVHAALCSMASGIENSSNHCSFTIRVYGEKGWCGPFVHCWAPNSNPFPTTKDLYFFIWIWICKWEFLENEIPTEGPLGKVTGRPGDRNELS